LLYSCSPFARVATLGSEPTPVWDVFERRLSALGYVEGHNLVLERRWSHGFTERVPGLVSEAVRSHPAVLETSMLPPMADINAADCVPILAIGVAEPYGPCRVYPVAHLSAASSARQLGETHVRLAKAAVPTATRLAVVTQSTQPFLVQYVNALRLAAESRRLELLVVDVTRDPGLETIIASIARQAPDAVVVAPGFAQPHARRQVVSQALRMRIPVVGSHLADGVVIAADYDWRHLAARAADLVDMILKGVPAARLDRDAAVKFEIVLDRRNARAIGLDLPESLVQEADRVLD
jgi:putative ABC transport system substrate-binding protein